jgi:hypothetical protein
MQCFAIPFKPLGVRKMAKTVSCSNTTNIKLSDEQKDENGVPSEDARYHLRSALKAVIGTFSGAVKIGLLLFAYST